jgi:hypothetical protein
VYGVNLNIETFLAVLKSSLGNPCSRCFKPLTLFAPLIVNYEENYLLEIPDARCKSFIKIPIEMSLNDEGEWLNCAAVEAERE